MGQANGVPVRADTGQRGGGGAKQGPWGAAGAVLAGPGGRCPLVCAAEEFLPDRAGSEEPALLLPFILKTGPFLMFPQVNVYVDTRTHAHTHKHIIYKWIRVSSLASCAGTV